MATLQLYGKVGANVFGGEAAGDAGQMDFLSDAIRATLHTTTYVPNIDTDEAFADATNEVATANGYTANGIAIATKSVSYAAGGNVTTYDMDDTTVTWTASGAGITFRYIVFHDDTVSTGPPIKPLIGYIDATSQTIASGNILLVTTSATGLFTVTVT